MKRKHLLRAVALLALAMGSMQCFADDVIVVHPVEGSTPIETPLSQVAKITFNEIGMVIATPTGEVAVPYEQIQSVKFAEGVTDALTTIAGDTKSLKVKYADGRLNISGADGPIDVAIFSISGKLLLSSPSCTAKTIDVSRLSAGAYIAKINSVVVKFVKH